MPCCGRQPFPHLRHEILNRRDTSMRPEPTNNITNIADAARRGQPSSQINSLPAHGARLRGLSLCSVRGREKREVERPAAHIAAIHVQRPLRITRGVARLTKITEALRHPGRQIRFIEIREPRRVILMSRTVKRPFCRGKSRATRAGIIASRLPMCLHDQAFCKQRC